MTAEVRGDPSSSLALQNFRLAAKTLRFDYQNPWAALARARKEGNFKKWRGAWDEVRTWFQEHSS